MLFLDASAIGLNHQRGSAGWNVLTHLNTTNSASLVFQRVSLLFRAVVLSWAATFFLDFVTDPGGKFVLLTSNRIGKLLAKRASHFELVPQRLTEFDQFGDKVILVKIFFKTLLGVEPL